MVCIPWSSKLDYYNTIMLITYMFYTMIVISYLCKMNNFTFNQLTK